MESQHTPIESTQQPEAKVLDDTHIEEEHDVHQQNLHKSEEEPKAKISESSVQKTTPEEFEDLAKGCIYGAFIGDALGAFLEFQSQVTPEELDRGMEMPGGGPFKLGAGQVTDDSELAQALMYGLIDGNGTLDLDLIAQQYGAWYDSGPFDIGITIRNAAKPASEVDKDFARAARKGSERSIQSQSNGGLMRITPLAVWASKLRRSDLVKAVWEETRLSHPNTIALNASIIYVYAIQHLLNYKADNIGAYDKCKKLAEDINDKEILSWFHEVESGILPPANKLIGWLKIAFVHALYYLKHKVDYLTALKELLSKAGDTDTNLCIVGGVLGALYGYKSLPKDYIEKVMRIEADQRVYREPEWYPGTHLEGSIEKLIQIRPTELKMKASESENYENVISYKGPPKVSDDE